MKTERHWRDSYMALREACAKYLGMEDGFSAGDLEMHAEEKAELERERDEARAQVAQRKAELGEYADALSGAHRERDEAHRENARLSSELATLASRYNKARGVITRALFLYENGRTFDAMQELRWFLASNPEGGEG